MSGPQSSHAKQPDSALLQGLLLVVVWPCIVGFTAAGTFFTVRYQQQINQQLNTGFGSTICLSFINIISSQAVSYTTEFEQWHPNVRTNVSRQPTTRSRTLQFCGMVLKCMQACC